MAYFIAYGFINAVQTLIFCRPVQVVFFFCWLMIGSVETMCTVCLGPTASFTNAVAAGHVETSNSFPSARIRLKSASRKQIAIPIDKRWRWPKTIQICFVRNSPLRWHDNAAGIQHWRTVERSFMQNCFVVDTANPSCTHKRTAIEDWLCNMSLSNVLRTRRDMISALFVLVYVLFLLCVCAGKFGNSNPSTCFRISPHLCAWQGVVAILPLQILRGVLSCAFAEPFFFVCNFGWRPECYTICL